MKQPDRGKMIEIHPALRTGSTFPLHRFGSENAFAKWKTQILHGDKVSDEDVGNAADLEVHAGLALHDLSSSFRGSGGRRKIDDVTLALIPSQRNPPSLFGISLIDRIPESVFDEVASEEAKAPPLLPNLKPAPNKLADQNGRRMMGVFPKAGGVLPITGRVLRLRDGRVGRFGWKANVASLKEITLLACSSELGLEVPGIPRAAPPWKKDYKAPGLDLSAQQCDQLIQFVASLPRPTQRPSETAQYAEEIVAGQKIFSNVGCATCHRPKLGEVDGIYSDLLLHDMGQLLSDSGSYSAFVASNGTRDPLPVRTRIEAKNTKEQPPKFGASTREWRTPPLWGLRESAPYLHDGRADTIADAVALHGGEGLLAAEAFFDLKPNERQQVELFLQSLAAPGQDRR